MTPIDRFERQLPAALTDLADPRTPDYFIDILGLTARTRQRPAWTSPERWLPMDIATTRVPMTRFPWRTVGVLALIALLALAALAAFVGSRPTLPTPFGPAANGLIAYGEAGEIYTLDPETGSRTPLVSHEGTDHSPVFSLDGSRIAFARLAGGKSLLFVAAADGSDARQVTPDTLAGLTDWSFSPDGRSIVALASIDGRVQIVVAAADGNAAVQYFDVGATEGDGAPQYRPLDGNEIAFVGQEAGQPNRGIYGLDPSTGDVREIIPPRASQDIHAFAWSPDGSQLVYGVHDPTSEVISARTYVMSADGTDDRRLDQHPDAIADFHVAWSNDGTRVIVGRFFSPEGAAQHAVVPVDGRDLGVELECPPAGEVGVCAEWDWSWSPDDSMLVGLLTGTARTDRVVADPLTGETRVVDWPVSAMDWQRRSP
jgi:dipeptidyl aminopeptidase/acylaminoacyl peptidase